MSARFVLYQHLTVQDVTRTGSDVRVVIADPNGTPRCINWSFDDVTTAEERACIVEGWRDAATRLTYVGGSSESALVDDAQLFRTAFAGEAPGAQPGTSTFG
jgi:hypothetical protein